MKRILALTILFLSATCIYAQSCPSGTVPIEGGGTCATTAAGALANLGGAALAGAAFTGPVSAPFLNTIPQADQFSGADMCVKIRAAATYALTNGINQVDATHFSGTQACSVDMLGGISVVSPAAPQPSINLVINLGAVHIQSSHTQTISNSGVTLHGMGPMQTQIEYAGSSTPYILKVGPASSPGVSNYIQSVQIEGIFIYGGISNATDAVLIQATNRSQFRNLYTWGVTGCGIHEQFAITNTLTTPRTSVADAQTLGIQSGHSVPASGLCLDTLSGNLTTGNGTVIDAAAEQVTGVGWKLTAASGMIFSGGTSEGNLAGVEVDYGNGGLENVFIAPDLEANTSGTDFTDNGNGTLIQNPFASSLGASSSLILGSNSTNLWVQGGQFSSQTIISGASNYLICYGGSTNCTGDFLLTGTINTTVLNATTVGATNFNAPTGTFSGLAFNATSASAASVQTVAAWLNPNTGAGSGVQAFLGAFNNVYASSISAKSINGATLDHDSDLWLQSRLVGGTLNYGVYIDYNGVVHLGAVGTTVDTSGNLANSHGIVMPSTALGYQGPAAGYVQLALASSAITSATGGTNTGTVTCLTAACTNISGTYSVVGSTFTTGNLLVLVWPTTTTAYHCWTSQNGGVATYGIGHSVATATGMTITAGISVATATVTIDYGCSAN